jgi:membrane fusion protein, copper/silver efflux system
MGKRTLTVLVLCVLATLGAVWWHWHGPAGESLPPSYGSAARKQKYQCAMHPQIVSDTPGNCPICGMKLQPVEDEPTAAHEGGTGVPAPSAPVPGHAPFALSTARQQLIGVRRAKVEYRSLAIAIRATGTVAYDPGLYQAVVEYRQAVRAKAQLAQSTLPEALSGAEGLVRAAALKLRQKGISDAQLAAIARGGADPTNLLLPGKSVWVYAQVYEYELGLVRVGQPVTITAPSLPGRRFTSRIAAIDPVLDPATRTARVRVPVSTPQADLRPESFVDVTIEVPLGERLAVPEDAVLDTGTHRIVFVVRGEGDFDPRAVELGRDAQGFYEVLSGLSAGEEVVVAANFLIDSESRFRSALRSFDGGAGGAAQGHEAH